MYYLTTYWFPAWNSDSYLLKENVLDINTLCSSVTSLPLYKYHTHELYTCNPHSVPAEFLCPFPSCNSSSRHTRALHLPYKCCTKLFATWAKVQPRLTLDACLLCSVSPHEPYCWNQMPLKIHTQPHCFTQVYRCSSHGNRLLLSQTLLSLWNRILHSEIGNYIVKAMKKKPWCEDPNISR